MFNLQKEHVVISQEILNTDIAQNGVLFALFHLILLEANFEEKTILWKDEPKVLKKGECILNVKSLSNQWQLAPSIIRKHLAYLEKTKKIILSPYKHLMLISLLNAD